MRGARCSITMFNGDRTWVKWGKLAHNKLVLRGFKETTPKAPARKPLLHRGGKP